MAKELYLYSPIYDFVAQNLIAQMEDNKSEDIVIRANTPGGSVFSGWGIIAKMNEHKGKITMKVDGLVASMGTFILAFAEDSEALDVSKIHLHRADMPVRNPGDQEFLDSVNNDLKAKLTQKINVVKLKELKGITIEDLFDPTKRIDAWLSAKEARAVGLVNRIVELSAVEMSSLAAINTWFQVAAEKTGLPINAGMTVEQFIVNHPDLYAEIVEMGVKQERDRVGAWITFVEIDAAAVILGINSGETLSQKTMAEFTLKALTGQALLNLAAMNAPGFKTSESDNSIQSDKEKELADFEASVRKSIGLKGRSN